MKKIVNCGHRGSPVHAPENTLKAFRTAVEMGADMIELDARMTSDGIAIINHDKTYKRTTGNPAPTSELTYRQVKELRFNGEPVPTLEETVALCKESGIKINIECKESGAVSEAIRLMNNYGIASGSMISEFDARALKESKEIDASVDTGFLTLPVLTPFPLLRAKKLGCAWINPNKAQINPMFVSRAHRLGLKVIPWTVNDADMMRRFIDIGVDGFITNYPDVLSKIKAERGVE